MNTNRRNWSIGPFTMWRARIGNRLKGTVSRDNPLAERVDGVSITDKDNGLIYEATVGQANGQVWLSSVTIITTRKGQRIDQDTIRRVPVQRIAEQVALHLARQERDGMPLFSTRPHHGKQDGPTVEEVAAEWKKGKRREDIATLHNASPYTIDKRIREARDRGLIPEATTGRPRTKTSAPTRKPNNERKTSK